MLKKRKPQELFIAMKLIIVQKEKLKKKIRQLILHLVNTKTIKYWKESIALIMQQLQLQ